ncbi:MAG TPA: MFS transporter [Chitinophagaceae bacterium]|nr:MFS transporter [Chitinophagaceae bacterium]
MHHNDEHKKQIRAWTFYDWANSSYSLIITSAIFPAYYSAIVPEQIQLFGHAFHRAALASYSISFSFLLIAFLSPLLSSMADYLGNKKMFMRFFCYLGSLSCMALFFFVQKPGGDSNYLYGLLCSVLASVGYCGSIVFYNAFLPEIADATEQDAVSARGFAMGYIGSVILMLICLIVILCNEQASLGWGDYPVRFSFVAVGLWWAGFAQISFQGLKEQVRKHGDDAADWIRGGYRELRMVWSQLQHLPALKKFLAAFFFYNTGVQTVMYMATYFASDEMHMQTTQLLSVVMIIQLVAIAGSWLFARLSGRKGNLFALSILVFCWIGICIFAYRVQSLSGFYLIAFAIGMVMGGIQSLSRSTYSKLLPVTSDTASYFSFYDIAEKTGIVIGTLSFGLIADWLGGMRNAALGLSLFFIAGLFFLFRLRKH